jgi:hydroxyethylthiazole kinase
MQKITKNIIRDLKLLKQKNPLVLNITNYVVMNTTANALFALGASPIMAHATPELKEMLAISHSLVINIGTLDATWFRSMKQAVQLAKKMKKPVILDPVGAGATELRTKKSLELLRSGGITIVRGNFGEISALTGSTGLTKGTQAIGFTPEKSGKLAKLCANKFKTITAVTGPIDFVSDGKSIYELRNGVSLLEKVTGTGCTASALIGAMAAVTNPLLAAISGISILNLAAEQAYRESQTPGSFSIKLLDWLYKMDEQLISTKLNII